MYATILFPTDGSAPARAARDHAFDLAERHDAVLHAVFVVDTAAFAVPDVDATLVVEGIEREGERVLDAVAAAAEDRDIPVTTALLRGAPADEIVAYADEHAVDCVVVGTHGRRGLARTLLGSTTSRILRSATAPVLVVRAPAA